jgi:hypothetical protein
VGLEVSKSSTDLDSAWIPSSPSSSDGILAACFQRIQRERCNHLNVDLDEDNLSPSTINQLNSLSRFGLSEKALVLYGRWWQFEDWLRQLAYVELRSKYGQDWSLHVSGTTSNQEKDAEWTHMLARDNENPLAYLDFPKLSDLMISEWEIFKTVLPRQETWKSHASELNMVRRRVAHLRLSHPDDLSRLEQALRDLERGAFIALASYNSRWPAQATDPTDPLIDGWVKKNHPDARRLIAHADSQYEVTFDLRESRRPWAKQKAPGPGKLWHAEFYSRRSPIDLAKLWRNGYFSKARELVIHVEANSQHSLALTYADVDDHQEIADAIGNAFDAILLSPSWTGDETSQYEWLRKARELNYRITAGSGWNIVDESTLPISIFGSGGSVQDLPQW